MDPLLEGGCKLSGRKLCVYVEQRLQSCSEVGLGRTLFPLLNCMTLGNGFDLSELRFQL